MFCMSDLVPGTQCEVNPNDCSSSPCMNGASCEDGIGRYICHCGSGWSGKVTFSDACNYKIATVASEFISGAKIW